MTIEFLIKIIYDLLPTMWMMVLALMLMRMLDPVARLGAIIGSVEKH